MTREQGGDSAALPTDEEMYDLVEQGHFFVNFVDALRMANHDLNDIRLNEVSGEIEVYEGGNLTGFDKTIFERQHAINPFHLHSVFTDDTDQLTSNWTAADFRRVARKVVEAAKHAETETVVSTLRGEKDLFMRPVVFEVPKPETKADATVFDDLSFPSPKLTGAAIWNWTAWMDTPLVVIDGKSFAVSNLVKTALGVASESHMLRLAARVDQTQYSQVSQLREDRMIHRCQNILEASGWTVVPKFRLSNPKAEIDVYAKRGSETLYIELKSTLRPESPWESHKRNEDILKGIGQVHDAVKRLGGGIGFVLTDGYRGDHDTWARAISAGVSTGTLDDVDLIARSPKPASEEIKRRAGIDSSAGLSGPIGTREFVLAGRIVKLIDAPAPT